jgi:hypothetical protein
MRRLATLVVLFLAIGAGSARANAFGQLIPASPLMGGNNLFGVHLLLGDRVDDVGLLGQVRFSSSPKLDWGLQLGFTDAGDGGVMLGGDIRPILRRQDDEVPLDLAFDGGLGLTITDNVTVFELVPAIEGSHRFAMDSGGALSPYLGVGLDVNISSFDNNGNGDNSDTNVDVVARFGLEWEVSSKFGIQGEFGVGDPANDFIMGVNVAF